MSWFELKLYFSSSLLSNIGMDFITKVWENTVFMRNLEKYQPGRGIDQMDEDKDLVCNTLLHNSLAMLHVGK